VDLLALTNEDVITRLVVEPMVKMFNRNEEWVSKNNLDVIKLIKPYLGCDMMLAAELCGKISPIKPAHQRMEDVLTSYIFSAFRYLNDQSVPLAFLSKAKNLSGQNFILKQVSDIYVFFWPCFSFGNGRFREADVLVLISKSSGEKVAVIVEAKYESGLSNLASVGMDLAHSQEFQVLNSVQFRHQLADEFCGIQCATFLAPEIRQKLEGVHQRLLLYVTANHVIPKLEIGEGIEEIRKRPCSKPECVKKAEENIYWVSWRHLHQILSDSRVYAPYSMGERNFLFDLRRVLELRELDWFSPFTNLS